MTHSARVYLGFDALFCPHVLFALALEGQKLPVVTRMTLALDRFHHLSQYGIAVCRQCLCAVWPAQAYAHLTSKAHRLPKYEARSIANDLDGWQGLCSQGEFQPPVLSVEYILELSLYHDGVRCLLQQDDVPCHYVCRNMKSLKEHWRRRHQWKLQLTRGGSGFAQKELVAKQLAKAMRHVRCQRFFLHGQHSSYFEVYTSDLTISMSTVSAVSIAAEVRSELATLEEQRRKHGQVMHDSASAKEVSPWLQLTRWPRYLKGYPLPCLAALAALPQDGSHPILHLLCSSLDRLVEMAYQSICEDRINVFDQARINSFLQRPRATDRPLMVKLQKTTYRQYKGVWKRLLCFVYRTAQHSQPIRLDHRLTSRQTDDLGRATSQAERLINLTENGAETDILIRAQETLDKSCLDLCISLLDHDLTGDLFESVAVGFLAVQGIDVDKLILREACSYGACLSGFVKIAQMLVVQQAVVMTETGKAECPSHIIDEMRERFMIQGSRSPFNWACRLRMYAKKVRDSTTCLGYITWTDDGQKVSYKDVRDLSMVDFQTFIRTEVEKCQFALEELLLLHPQERREDLGVAVSTYKLVDNPAENRNGWSFLQHHENLLGPLPDRQSWLLDRVLSNGWLHEEFLSKDAAGRTVWRYGNAKAYKEKVTRFLELLLLLIHLTSGHPARGTEILSIRHMNTVHGHHRNIFIENGMVSTVTSYHKGYNVTGSTKIIHRYLPKEVGELLIYYLWLILPFCQQLELLAFRNSAQTSPFLWAKDKGGDTWDSSQLSRVMRREFELELGLPIGLSVYRHLAIAISRKHLPCGGFKRDYGHEDTKLDAQSSHSSWTAGSVYARGLQEAAGHVDMRKSEYRSISRQWHEFLGFLPTSLPSRKRRLGDMSGYDSPQEKRTRIVNP